MRRGAGGIGAAGGLCSPGKGHSSGMAVLCLPAHWLEKLQEEISVLGDPMLLVG